MTADTLDTIDTVDAVDKPQTATQGFIGRPLDRVDGPAKTTGTARYTADHQLPDLAHAALVHATIPRGRITAIDTSRAEDYPEVIAVITHQNAPRLKPHRGLNPLDLSTMAPGSRILDLNTDEIAYDGQPIAVVVAATAEAAHAAAALVRAEYAPLDPAVDFRAALPHATVDRGMPIGPRIAARKGKATEALAAAEVTVDLEFTTPQHNHNAIEPHATIASWEQGRLTVYDATQQIDWVRRHLAHMFDLDLADVRVISTYVGGAFGGKSMVWPHTPLACLAARVTGRPVKLVLTRNGLNRIVGARTPTVQRVALGATREGRLTALIHTATTRTGRAGGNSEQVTACSNDLYDADTVLIEQRSVPLDLTPNTPMRAPGESTGTFALESAIDALAYKLGQDPVDLRLRNISPAVSTVHGTPFSHRRFHDMLERGRALFGWDQRSRQPGSMRDGDQLIGFGVALAWHPAWQFTTNLSLCVARDGSVVARCAFHEMGMGGPTAQAQVIADLLAVDVERVTVQHGDSAMPFGPGAGGSAQSASLVGAALKASALLRDALLALARRDRSSPLFGARPQQVESRDGGLYIAGTLMGESYAAILTRAGRPSVEVVVGADHGVRRTLGDLRFLASLVRDGRRTIRAASGAHFCEVRVDRHTGEIRVSRWLGIFDIGRVLNHKTAASQLRGGIVMGLGLAMSEATLIDPRSGRVMNPGIAEYHIPVHADTPRIDVVCLDDPDPEMPLGVLGAGEVGITGVGAAVANAVFHATGKRVCDLPITLDKLL
ncbi:MAG TPA: xanthine dehydrogenase family protein molybdopterin-binding subunit [Roseiflexaceae bacterium]|nr:xanthine dehydrogenase family protein molybdopterin-binding subunit [Roseiflexaceae bacterium]